LLTLALPDRFLIASHAMNWPDTFATLDKFIIMDDATLEDASSQLGSLALEGPKAAAVVRALCGLDPQTLGEFAHREVTLGGIACRLLRRSRFGELGAELLAPRAQLAALWPALAEAARAQGGGPVGYAAWNALRLEAGIPWFGYDFDSTVIPQEASLETSHISFTKGCYTGQEIVERVRSRGHVNRRRVGLQFAGESVPPGGAKLLFEGKDVGHVTSAALSPALGQVIGMGYLRREHTAPGSKVEWSGGTAEVIELPVSGARAAFRG
jgi:folate-binding protein YgfZ